MVIEAIAAIDAIEEAPTDDLPPGLCCANTRQRKTSDGILLEKHHIGI